MRLVISYTSSCEFMLGGVAKCVGDTVLSLMSDGL